MTKTKILLTVTPPMQLLSPDPTQCGLRGIQRGKTRSNAWSACGI